MPQSTISIRGSTQPKTWHRDVRYRCILLQLSAGVSYCIAAESPGSERRQTANLKRALRAYETASDWTHATDLTPQMKHDVGTKAAHLKQLLRRDRMIGALLALETWRANLNLLPHGDNEGND